MTTIKPNADLKRVHVSVRDPKTRTSKNVTIYNATVEQVVLLLQGKAVQDAR